MSPRTLPASSFVVLHERSSFADLCVFAADNRESVLESDSLVPEAPDANMANASLACPPQCNSLL